jgi:hypothetical protein
MIQAVPLIDPWARFKALVLYMATVILNQGHAITTNLVTGIGGTVPKYIGWGTGTQTTALVTDTGLGPTTVEKLVDLTTSGGTDHTTSTPTRTTTTNTNDTATFTGTRTATGAGAVTVAGLFDAASGGTCWVKGDFAAINLASGDSIAFTFNVKFA